ncbi:unnamed protein product [Sphacelaria rigidula]
MCLLNLPRELGSSSMKTPTIFPDSQGALNLSSNSNYSTSSKHPAIKFFHLKDTMRNDQIITNHVKSENQLADILTEYCEKVVHQRLLQQVEDFGK